MTEQETMAHRHPGSPDDAQQDQLPASVPGRPASPQILGSSQPTAISEVEPSGEAHPPSALRGGKVRIGDRIFFWITAGSGGLIIILISLIATFLVTKAIPAIRKDNANFFFSRGFDVGLHTLKFGVVDLLWTTVISSTIALVIATPVAIGIALFITQYAPGPLRKPIGYVIDLLAAIPSIIYGIWGIFVLAPHLEVVQRALYHLGFIPLFKDQGYARGTIFDASVVLAIMILPIITAISRDVFERTPRENIEAAWALGATRWEMIRLAVLPYGRPGVVSGAMLGLGRALGETIAVLFILSKPPTNAPFSFSIFNGGRTFASLIGSNMKEAQGEIQTGAYIAAGLVLFILTFAVNAAARAIVNRRREFS
jgi:phosphate transport system permease protein